MTNSKQTSIENKWTHEQLAGMNMKELEALFDDTLQSYNYLMEKRQVMAGKILWLQHEMGKI